MRLGKGCEELLGACYGGMGPLARAWRPLPYLLLRAVVGTSSARATSPCFTTTFQIGLNTWKTRTCNLSLMPPFARVHVAIMMRSDMPITICEDGVFPSMCEPAKS